MEFKTSIQVIDTHTAGEPTRIILSGIPFIQGKTMQEKKLRFKQEFDLLRRVICCEPRGHNDMYAACITPPASNSAKFGVIFMDGDGCFNMCGHGTIGVATAAVEMGLIKPEENQSNQINFNIDTPSGIVEVKVNLTNGKPSEVSVINVPAFLYQEDYTLTIPEFGDINLDIAFGGNFFALIDVNQFKIDIKSQYVAKLIDFGKKVLSQLTKEIHVIHPVIPEINEVDHVEFYTSPLNSPLFAKNVVVIKGGQFDRSPCGTGTCAKLACLYHKKLINKSDKFIHEGILGTTFQGRVIGETKVGKYDAIVPEITGRAFITGFNHLVVDPDDPLAYGFKINVI